MAALVHRAYELKTITEAQRRYLYINMAKRGYRTCEPIEADVPVERPFLLARITESHLSALNYTRSELMKVLFMNDESELKSVYLGQALMQLVG